MIPELGYLRAADNDTCSSQCKSLGAAPRASPVYFSGSNYVVPTSGHDNAHDTDAGAPCWSRSVQWVSGDERFVVQNVMSSIERHASQNSIALPRETPHTHTLAFLRRNYQSSETCDTDLKNTYLHQVSFSQMHSV